MKTRFLQQLNRNASRVGLGTMVFRTAPRETTFQMLDAWTEAGGNLLDAAEVYGSEPAVADWIEARGCRDEIILLDKACIDLRDITPEGIRNGVNGNLERLRTDAVDIWMLHRDDPTKPIEAIVETANEQIALGKIRAWGGSNWTTERIVEANECADQRGLQPMIGSSENISLAMPNEPRWPGVLSLTPEDIAWRRKTGFPVFAWSAQAGGFFSGNYSPNDRSNSEMARVYYSGENFEKLKRARQLAAEKNASAVQIALAYLLALDLPVFPLVGPRSLDELRSCIAAEKIALSPDETDWLSLKRDRLQTKMQENAQEDRGNDR